MSAIAESALCNLMRHSPVAGGSTSCLHGILLTLALSQVNAPVHFLFVPKPMSDPTPPAGSPDAPAIAVDGQQQKKPQSQMTKAERRAMQEAQRAAKAAKKEAEAKDQPAKAPKPKPQASGSQSPPPKPKPQAPQAPQAPPPDAQQPREKPAASKGGGGGGGGEAPESSKREKTPKKPKFDPADLHPAILRLGVQYQNREIIGGNARCVAMLAAFKHLIQDYKPATKDTSGTPSSVGRNDLVLHFKKPIEYLISCRCLHFVALPLRTFTLSVRFCYTLLQFPCGSITLCYIVVARLLHFVEFTSYTSVTAPHFFSVVVIWRHGSCPTRRGCRVSRYESH